MSQSPFALSDATVDFDQFVTQFQAKLSNDATWRGTLTTQTSTALIQLISTIGTFNNAKLLRYFEDSFPDTVQSDGAIRAIAVMQGIRLTRKLPASVPVTMTSPVDVTLSPYTQINIGGYLCFNRDVLTLEANVPLDTPVYEGEVKAYQVSGLGSDLQAFVSVEDAFAVSDHDVVVMLNSNILPKAYGGLWNYENLPAYSDLTHSDGRLMIQFGSGKYGTKPSVNDLVTVIYVLTKGGNGDSLVTFNKRLIVTGYPDISGVAYANPTGGADEKSTLAYKNVESGAFGTYSSAVTKPQYKAIVNLYPGIVDAITQAQRELNPRDVKWMNVIRVAALTTSPWTAEQKRDFCKFCQEVSMYAPYFIWQDPIPIGRDVSVAVYCFNTAIPSEVESKVRAGLKNLFSAQPGLLMTNFHESDLVEACFAAAPGEISYVKVLSPAGSMIVTAPESPQPTATVIPGAGILSPLVYAYGISTVTESGEEGPPAHWVFPQVVSGLNAAINISWPENKSAAAYKIYGRKAGSIGLLATIPAGTLFWSDNGTVDPTGDPPNQLADTPVRYNSLRDLSVTVQFSDRQQKINLG